MDQNDFNTFNPVSHFPGVDILTIINILTILIYIFTSLFSHMIKKTPVFYSNIISCETLLKTVKYFLNISKILVKYFLKSCRQTYFTVYPHLYACAFINFGNLLWCFE